MSFLRSRSGLVVLGVAVVVGLFVFHPGAQRVHTTLVREISTALGRQVEIGKVSVQLLPQPGFDLQNFVVHEDPAFGVEPTLRADEVTATLRLTSLLRGRLEIARLSFSEPSLNLVRNRAGRWNLENVLLRADQTRVAPTSKSKTEVRPGFPYIEASSARINFKFGAEKKPYRLNDADFSLWQDSEDTWAMRLKAEPLRTDFNLSDTGTIRIQGSWQRAANLRDTPLQFNVQWQQGQLGQASTLFYGNDQGWRGTVGISATLTGTPADLAISGLASVDNFRRYDLDGAGALRLAAQCNAHYLPMEARLAKIACAAPVAAGSVDLTGSVSGSGGSRLYDLNLTAQNVPMQSMVSLARHTKKGIAEDLVATGSLDAAFKLTRAGSAASETSWSGKGEARNFGISSTQAGLSLVLDKVPFSLSAGSPSRNPAHRLATDGSHILAGPHLQVGPFKLGLDRPTPVMVSGWSSRSEYAISLEGEAGVSRLLHLARSLGFPAAPTNANGSANLDLHIAGQWSAFSAPTILGHAQLKSVRADVHGLNEPLEIGAASVALLPDGVEVKNLTASLAGSTWHGSLALPRQCGLPGQCLVHFNLHADTIATDDWSQAFNSRGKGPWYRFFASNQPASYLLNLRASGQVTANRVMLHKLQASHVSANVNLEGGALRLTDLEGNVLGGKHHGEWKADFTAKPPEYSGSGSFQQVDLGRLSSAMHDEWIAGTGSGSYRASTAGLSAAELKASAQGSLQVEDFDGTMKHLVLDPEAGPLRVQRFTGSLLLQDGNVEISKAELQAPGGFYQVSGKVSLGGVLNLKLTRAQASGYSIAGSLAAPTVSEVVPARTRAALKP